jgi:hypothetical protein
MPLELTTRYTVWSRGQLVGETDLGFIFRGFNRRTGWFHPTEQGDKLMPDATGVSPALRTVWAIGRDATAEADLQAAIDAQERLDLELRGPDGAVIETGDIAIIDTHYLISLGELSDVDDDEVELTPEQQAWVDEMLEAFPDEPDEPWRPSDEESELPRYQIQVELRDPDAIP